MHDFVGYCFELVSLLDRGSRNDAVDQISHIDSFLQESLE